MLGRSEWCISRQRSWGVPIPVLYDVDTGEAHLTVDTLDHIIPVLASKGTDYWWSDDVDAFVPAHLKSTGKQFRKGTDTMDVWFDSGSSWTLLKDLALRSPQEYLADVYLEGSDQHRGWFQSSLLTYLASIEGDNSGAPAPYKTLITHGMVLDQDGQKMSKSLGNGLTPMEVIHGGKVCEALYKWKGMRCLYLPQCDRTRRNFRRTVPISSDFGQHKSTILETLPSDRPLCLQRQRTQERSEMPSSSSWAMLTERTLNLRNWRMWNSD